MTHLNLIVHLVVFVYLWLSVAPRAISHNVKVRRRRWEENKYRRYPGSPLLTWVSGRKLEGDLSDCGENQLSWAQGIAPKLSPSWHSSGLKRPLRQKWPSSGAGHLGPAKSSSSAKALLGPGAVLFSVLASLPGLEQEAGVQWFHMNVHLGIQTHSGHP